MSITKEQAHELAEKFKVNYEVVSPNIWLYALNVELEHKNVTHGALSKTAKIVLAHLEESPDYYQRLAKLEKAAARYWKNHEKPQVTKK